MTKQQMIETIKKREKDLWNELLESEEKMEKILSNQFHCRINGMRFFN